MIIYIFNRVDFFDVSWNVRKAKFFRLSSVHLSQSVVSNSLWHQGPQHTRLPCPSPTPGSCFNSYPLSWWCHRTIPSCVIPFSSCLQSFPASESFSMSQFLSGGQSIGDSASASVLPMNIQDSFPLGLMGLISFSIKGTFRCLFQWVGSSHRFAKALELHLQHHSFRWIVRVDFL